MATRWYVLHTKPQKETHVTRYLESQGFDVYLPALRIKPANPRSRCIRPLFPRYLFVKASLDESGFAELRWVPGVNELVSFGLHPATVHDRTIQAIQKQVAQLQATYGTESARFQPGDLVRITQGPLEGYEALFDMRLSGTERVRVLLHMLSRPVAVQIEERAIEKVVRQQ
jgi:transcriptional antiterminator RfaH